MSADRLVHARVMPRRVGPPTRSWWARAWVRAVEESAYDETHLVRGRSLARRGAVGGIAVAPGSASAGVVEGQEVWSVDVAVPVLEERAALLEVLAAEPGRAGALLAGDLPHDLVEHAEEAGAELLPDGRDLGCSCTCAAWVHPCRHALAVLLQLGWLLEDDPLLLLHLRGLPRTALLGALHAREPEVGPLEIALDAAERARRVLAILARGSGSEDLDHLW